MTGQIKFYDISYCDLSNENLSYTVVDSVATNTGEDIARNLSDRKLTSGWMTTGSDDTANTQIVCNLGDANDITDIFLVEMNFKSYTIEYWSGVAWTNVVTETVNDSTTKGHAVSINTDKIRITIQGTMTADDQKQMRQLIITGLLGQFNDWPIIRNTEHSLGKQVNEVLSGKAVINETVGAFRCSLRVNGWTNQEDIDLLESILFARKGVLMYINAGVPSNFRFRLLGYREQDFYVVRPENEYSNDLYSGLYNNRPDIEIDFVEVAGK